MCEPCAVQWLAQGHLICPVFDYRTQELSSNSNALTLDHGRRFGYYCQKLTTLTDRGVWHYRKIDECYWTWNLSMYLKKYIYTRLIFRSGMSNIFIYECWWQTNIFTLTSYLLRAMPTRKASHCTRIIEAIRTRITYPYSGRISIANPAIFNHVKCRRNDLEPQYKHRSNYGTCVSGTPFYGSRNWSGTNYKKQKWPWHIPEFRIFFLPGMF